MKISLFSTEGNLGPSITPLILEALKRVACEPEGLPLVGGKAGLFAANGIGREAARHCKEQGLVRVLRSDIKGKTSSEICVITDRGLDLLTEQVDPFILLERLQHDLETQGRSWRAALENLQHGKDRLTLLQQAVERVLERCPGHSNSGSAVDGFRLEPKILAKLRTWQREGTLGDFPLPDLFQSVADDVPTMKLGEFHDTLRRLHEDKSIYLHPWTGPLYQLPEPAFALLVGHEIAYYASLRSESPLG